MTAQTMFTEHGYNSVSMRDIAEAMDISVGNLTYHFKKKEDLIEAIIIDLHHRYVPSTPPRTLQELDHLIAHMQERHEMYAFYFSNRTQLSQVSQRIKEIQLKMLHENKVLWDSTLRNLTQAGLIIGEEYPHHFDYLIKTAQMVTIYWAEHSRLEQESNDAPLDFRTCVWGVFLPILTAAGKETYIKVLMT